ncbi:hypothetical protein [Bradyrhizobium sp. CB3481]|uniref:hypothetical protein n=1 Tax=Bradyrhizobium sp. CB3481 TaxID=3039158 RepID=UPI0024B21B60|nr:hypothetical protein [Bradyrhizobium sp. CB3481]WFU14349.1 hypothetical protein QA643_24470 [Bradyrhizobium sp. CB3481]
MPLEELLAKRDTAIENIVGQMTQDDRKFLVSVEEGTPDWNLLGVDGAASLPAVKWRQHDFDKLPTEKGLRL